MNRSYYIRSLFEYEGESKARHKIAGVALGLGGLSVAALAGHALAKDQSLLHSAQDLYGHVSRAFTPPSKIPWTDRQIPLNQLRQGGSQRV